MTVFLTTAYIDEAERCDRVGLMHRGRLIRCDAPAAFKTQTGDLCYKVRCPDQRAAKAYLKNAEGVASVESFGADLHLFLSPDRTTAEKLAGALDAAGLGPAQFVSTQPSLEDVFILLIRKEPGEAA